VAAENHALRVEMEQLSDTSLGSEFKSAGLVTGFWQGSVSLSAILAEVRS
jgi:hypothetical protein